MAQASAARVRKRGLGYELRRNWVMFLMLLPTVVYFGIFKYIPMGGAIIAFKNYKFPLGIMRSPWNGLDNFRFFLGNDKFGTLIGMTISYNLAFMVTGLIAQVGLALILSEIRSKAFKKISHSLIFLPYFISMVVVSFITYSLFNKSFGSINAGLAALGFAPFDFYGTSGIWPFILVVVSNWKGIGYGSIVYLAVITGINPELHESATIDGASVWQRIWFISLPHLKHTIIILTIMGLSGILAGGGEMFYQLIGNNPMLTKAADTIDTYIFRSLLNPGASVRYEINAALGLFQQICGFVLILAVNTATKFVSPEDAIF